MKIQLTNIQTYGFLTFIGACMAIIIFMGSAQAQPSIDEWRLGLMAHDAEENDEEGVDINAEALIKLDIDSESLLIPRPLIGVSINTEGDTSQIYGGAAWNIDIGDDFFSEIMLGVVAHDGETSKTARTDDRELGCSVMFREAFSFGYRMDESRSVMATISHISNAGLCDENSGLTNAGLRYSIRY
ncbi:MAG: acyloxyacyl hydrolase [Parvibaculales bacterium]